MEKPEIRQKTLLLCAGLALAGAIVFLRTHKLFPVFFILPAAFLAAAFVCPGVMAPVLRRLDNAATGLMRLVGVIVLTLFYFLVLTPYGLVFRMFKREKRGDSYWIKGHCAEQFDKQY